MDNNRDKVALEFMKTVLSTDRFSDYVDDENIMASIATDAYTMADEMEKASNVELEKVLTLNKDGEKEE